MSLLTRRDLLASSLFSTIAPMAFGGAPLAAMSTERSLPTLWWSDSSDAHIELGSLLPFPEIVQRFEELLVHARSSRRIVVHVMGRIAPVDGFDPHHSGWVTLCERFGVNEIIETSTRSRQVTPPMRVGQIDPAGIVYRINEAGRLA